jgi:hypothetical protein
MAIDNGNAKPNEMVHARAFNGILRRGTRRSKFLWRIINDLIFFSNK